MYNDVYSGDMEPHNKWDETPSLDRREGGETFSLPIPMSYLDMGWMSK